MKKIFFTLFLTILTVYSYSQTEFTLTDNAPVFPTQYIVLEFDSLTIEEMYARTLEWVSITYNTPKEVIKAKLENKYIRIEGVAPSAYENSFWGMTNFMDIKYMVEFAFKSNRIKFEVINTEILTSPSEYSAGGWVDFKIEYSGFNKKNGKPDIRYRKAANSVLITFNNLALAFDKYLNNPIEVSIKNDDW